MCENAFKRNEMVFLLYCFVQNTTNSHLRVLNKMREKIGILKRDQFYAILSKLILYEQDEIEIDTYNFYFRDAA